MKTAISAGIVGLILFALSASVSWYLINQSNANQQLAEEDADLETETGVPPIGRGIKKQEQLPVAIRPDLPLTVEAVLELSESIRRKEQDLIAREKLAEKNEQNIRLLFEDLKTERSELNALMEGMEAKLRIAQQTVAELRLENQQLTSKTEELAKLNQQRENRKKAGIEELDEIGQRVKTARPWFEGLEDEQAANYIKEFANNGDLQFAVRLLKSLQQRKASKILAAFNDPEFVQQILNALADEDKYSNSGDNSASNRNSNLR